MNPVNAALWYVESHFASDLTLEEIACRAGVSTFYLTRAFATVTGRPLMRYVRGRRLHGGRARVVGRRRGHACGYELAMKGIDTRRLQIYLGHRSITSTTIYTDLAEYANRQCLGRLAVEIDLHALRRTNLSPAKSGEALLPRV